MSRRRRAVRFQVVAVVMVVAAVTGLWATASAQPSPEDDGIDNLAACYARTGQMAVALVIDESGSLRNTDPTGSRVDFARAVVQALSAAAFVPVNGTPGRIDLRAVAFGSETEEVIGWRTIDVASADAVGAELEAFRGRNSDQDTDYVDALLNARADVLQRAASMNPDSPSSVCRAVVWFTDGKFDFEPVGGRPAWAQGLVVDSNAKVREAVAQGTTLLCDPGGLADQFRAGDSPTFLLTAALLSSSFDEADGALLERITTNSRGDCGSLSGRATGAFLAATDLGRLVPRVVVPILGPPPPTTVPVSVDRDRRSAEFAVDPLTMSATIVIDAVPDGAIRLVGPSGQQLDLAAASVDGVLDGGVVLSRRAGSTRVVIVDFADAPRSQTEVWRVEADAPAGGQVFDVYVARKTGLGLVPVSGDEWTRGEEGSAAFQLVNSSGDPVGAAAVGSADGISATVQHGGADSAGVPAAVAWDPGTGSFIVSYTPSPDEPSTKAFVTIGGSIVTAAGDPASLSGETSVNVRVPFAPSSDGVVDLGVLEALRSEPDSEGRQPALPLAADADVALIGDSESGGEVCLVEGSIVTFGSERAEVATGAGVTDGCVVVPRAGEAALPLEFSAKDPVDGPVSGTVRLTTRSDLQQDPTVIEVPVQGEVFIEPPVPVTDAGTFWLLVVVSFLLAALLWVALSWRTAFFKDVDEIQGFHIPDAVISPSSADFSRPAFKDSRWQFLRREGSREASIEADGVRLLFKAPVRLFAAQDAIVESPGRLAHGPLGGSGWKGRLGHQIQGQWVFVTEPSRDLEDSDEIRGDLFLFIMDGAGLEFGPSGLLERSYGELVRDHPRLKERLAKVVEKEPPDHGSTTSSGAPEDPFAVSS